MTNNQNIVEVADLVKVYKGKDVPAVDGLTFYVSEGEIFGLLGPNGAGKTTTISVLTSLLEATSGDIKIAGYTLEKDLTEIKNKIGVVSQDIALYEKLTAYENLAYFGSLYDINSNVLKERIDSLLHRLGLYKNKDVLLHRYSGGMKRRVNILAGILHNPKLLFLDEPTVGVDVQTRSVIRDFLIELKQQGTTIIYSSHMMEDIQMLCDKLIIIDNGKKVAQGSPKALIAEHKCTTLEDVFLNITGRKLRD